MSEAEIRAAHPDWTDEQVAAEVAKQETPAVTPPAPGTGDADNAAFAKMRRDMEAAEKRAKAAEDKLAEEARKKAEEEGRWKDLADQEKQKREALEAEKATERARANAERTANGLKFKDTGYALYLLDADKVDLTDAAAVKAALEQIATDRADLVGAAPAPGPTGGPAGGANSDPPKVTREELAKMTPQQVRALDPKVVREALAA